MADEKTLETVPRAPEKAFNGGEIGRDRRVSKGMRVGCNLLRSNRGLAKGDEVKRAIETAYGSRGSKAREKRTAEASE